ncbi:hypothetical protein M5K25_008169 [Dendrobium thyrsiflorum]|uniref:Uncharacterized protein n=1 Tax=Dendrobium thyrsiflorum TaxID=117978 RepID=A0ABD0V815_DENTH
MDLSPSQLRIFLLRKHHSLLSNTTVCFAVPVSFVMRASALLLYKVLWVSMYEKGSSTRQRSRMSLKV